MESSSLTPPPPPFSPPPSQENQAPAKGFQYASARRKTSLFRILLVFILPLIGIISAYFLLQTNQDFRQQASGNPYDVARADGQCLGPGEKCASGSSHFDSTCHLTEARCGAPITTNTITVKAGECLNSNSAGVKYICEGGGHVDLTCGGRNYRCGQKLAPTPPADKCSQQQHLNCTFGCDSATGKCKQGKTNNEACNNNSECTSLNCVAAPGGKYCMAAGTNLSTPVAEGGACGNTAYNKICQTGLICQANKCVKPNSVQIIPVGSCLVAGANCQGNQGYSDASCEGGTRCGIKPAPTPTQILTLTPIDATNFFTCFQQQGVWIQNQCWPAGTTATQVATRQNRALNDSCLHDNECSSGSCSPIGIQRICTPNVKSSNSTPRFATGAACKQDCASQGGGEAVCSSICSQYNTSDENLTQTGQAINTLTFRTFADYLTTNIQLNNEGLTGWERYTDPRALEANSRFGLVLTAEGALAYTGIGALTGAGSTATFGTTANLVNTGYSSYQAQQACAGATTPQEKTNCTMALTNAGLALLNVHTSGLSLAAQSSDDIMRATQLINQARLTNAGVSALEIGANTYQTYLTCQGENANSQACLLQGGLSVVHGLGSYGDLAYAAQANLRNTNIILSPNRSISNPESIVVHRQGAGIGLTPQWETNKRFLVNPLKDPWLGPISDKINSQIVRGKSDDIFDYFEEASSILGKEISIYSGNKTTFRESWDALNNLAQQNRRRLPMGEMVIQSQIAVCSHCTAALHTAGAQAGFASEVVSAYPAQKGDGHTWLEILDDAGEKAVVDVLHFPYPVEPDYAYWYYQSSLNLDVSPEKLRKAIYVAPAP